MPPPTSRRRVRGLLADCHVHFDSSSSEKVSRRPSVCASSPPPLEYRRHPYTLGCASDTPPMKPRHRTPVRLLTRSLARHSRQLFAQRVEHAGPSRGNRVPGRGLCQWEPLSGFRSSWRQRCEAHRLNGRQPWCRGRIPTQLPILVGQVRYLAPYLCTFWLVHGTAPSLSSLCVLCPPDRLTGYSNDDA